MGLLMELRLDVSPPEITRRAHRLIREISGNPDPYAGKKQEYNTRALALLPELRTQVEQAEDFLFDLGFRILRVRHHGDTARIEVMPKDFDRLLKNREVIISGLTVGILGYAFGNYLGVALAYLLERFM
mgnify:CR=1 FL=1